MHGTDGRREGLPFPGRSRRRLVDPAFLAVLVFLGAFYRWSIEPTLSTHRRDHTYSLLADAFLRGRADLPIFPDPRLLALPDPYDPAANAPFRRHDLSLYGGRYYTYHGPTPALVLFAPYKLLVGRNLTARAGALVLAFGAALAGCLLLRTLLRRFFPATPAPLLAVLCLGLGLCNAFPFLLRRPDVYELALLSGQLFLSFGLLALAVQSLRARGPTAAGLLAAGTCLGLAFAARPPLGVGILAIGWLWARPRASLRERLRWTLLALVPVAAAVVSVGLYNHTRFGSCLEFGISYQLAGVNARARGVFDPARMPSNLRLFLLSAPGYRAVFPFVRLETPLPAPLGGGFHPEPIAGLLFVCPFLAAILLTPVIGPLTGRRLDHRAAWILATLVAIGSTLLLVSASVLATFRYVADASSLLFVAAALGWCGLLQLPGPPWRRRVVAWALGLALAVGGAPHAAIGVTGYGDPLREKAPAEYTAVAAPFAPLERLLGGAAGLVVDARVVFPDLSPGESRAQPLLTTGREGVADSIAVRTLPGRRVRFQLDHWGSPPVVSDPVEVATDRPVAIRLVVANKVRVWLEGREIVEGRDLPYPFAAYTVGSRTFPGADVAPTFSGRIEVDRFRKLTSAELGAEVFAP